MATKTRRKTQDRKRVSAQGHEISYTGGKVVRATGTKAKTGRKAVKVAKRQTSTVNRPKVEGRAKKIAGRS